MPIYDYQCQSCKTTEEHLILNSDEEPKVCSSCKKGELVRLISASNFSLQGDGWYKKGFSGKKK